MCPAAGRLLNIPRPRQTASCLRQRHQCAGCAVMVVVCCDCLKQIFSDIGVQERSETSWRVVPTGLGPNKPLFHCSLPKHRTGTLRSVPPSTRCSIEWHTVAAVWRRKPGLHLHGPGRALLVWNLVSFACAPITAKGRGTGDCAAKLAALPLKVSHEWCEQVPHCCSPTTARPHAGPRAPALLECCYYNLSPRRTLSCTQNLPTETPLPRPPGERSAEVVPHSKWQEWAHSPFTGFSRYGAERKLRSASTLARRQGPASPVSMLMSASETLLGVPRAFTIGTEP